MAGFSAINNMKASDTIRLLVLNDSRPEVERLISMLNNAGKTTRAQHVESEEILTKLLQEQTWDLMLAQCECRSVTAETAIAVIRRLNRDIPVILITENDGTQIAVEGLKMGAKDVVRLDEDQHLLLVIDRELDNREQRHQRRLADRKLNEAERRNQKLLDSSRDAIAYVQDGMYLYANQSFAERFGYADREELECMPIIDMIAQRDLNKVKQFMREFALKGDDAERTELSFEGIREDGTSTTLTMEVANALFDDESCLQFLIAYSASDAAETSPKIKGEGSTSTVIAQAQLLEKLESAVKQALEEESTATLMYLSPDLFNDDYVQQLGEESVEQAIRQLATQVEAFLGSPEESLARIGQAGLALLIPDSSADDATEKAKSLTEFFRQYTFNVAGNTIQTTLSVGIAIINESSSSAKEALDCAVEAVTNLRSRGGSDSHALYESNSSLDEATRADIGKAVQSALDNNRFQLMFQPVISLRGSGEEHYEVFLRLLDDNRQPMSPSSFLDEAEKIGASTKIDRWAILETVKALANHHTRGHNTRAIVNLTCQSMCDDSLAPWLSVAFKAAKLDTSAIVFQVREVDVTSNLAQAQQFFDALKDIKCKTSISNFGCSLNPFETLEKLSVDYVKVHGSFTQDIQNNQESPEALSNLITQLLEAKKVTIVPFVENASVLATLWQAGVHYIQGHYLQGPTEAMDYDFSMEN